MGVEGISRTSHLVATRLGLGTSSLVFVGTKTSLRCSIPARKPSSWLAHFHLKFTNQKPAYGAGLWVNFGGSGGNRTRVRIVLFDQSICLDYFPFARKRI